MGVQLSKWGNSLGVRLPKLIVEQAQLRAGDQVEVSVAETGQVLLTPVQKKLTLENPVNGITPQNRHSETEWGEARGREAW
jgi:antitoxin MazE